MDQLPKPEISKWKKYLTIEPVIFVFLLSITISNSVRVDLIVYQTCRTYEASNSSVCDILHQNSASQDAIQLQRKIQPHTSLILILQSCITTIYPALLTFYLGPWSDQNGRKPIIHMALIGYMLEYAILCILSILNVNAYWYLLAPLASSLLGGFPAPIMAAVCYVSDVTDRESRAWHLVWVDSAYVAGNLMGIVTGPIIFYYFGYAMTFATSVTSVILGYLYCRSCVPESVQTTETSSTFRDLFNNSLLRECFLAAVQKRDGFDRSIVWKCMICIALHVVILQGNTTIMFMFTNIRLGWNLKNFSIFSSATHVVIIAGSMLLVKTVKSTGLPESINVLLSCTSILTCAIIQAFTKHPWQLYASSIVGMFGGTIAPVLRAIITKFVPHQDLGKIFSLTTSMEMIIPFLTTPIYVLVYANFPPPLYPNPVWFLPAFIAMVIFVLTCLIQRRISQVHGRSYQAFNQETEDY